MTECSSHNKCNVQGVLYMDPVQQSSYTNVYTLVMLCTKNIIHFLVFQNGYWTTYFDRNISNNCTPHQKRKKQAVKEF